MTGEGLRSLAEELAPGVIVGVLLLLGFILLIAFSDRRPRDPPDDP